MKKVLFILLSLFLFCSLPVAAQYYNFQNYTVEDGLPQSQVFTILQDSRSNLWFGTNGGGLCRFTGRGFDVYTRKDGLGSDLITQIIEDHDGKLIIQTAVGLSVFDGSTFQNFVIDSTQNVNADQMFMDKNGHIWFRTFADNIAPVIYKFDGKKLMRADEEYEVLKKFTFQNYLSATRDHTIMVSVGDKLYRFDGKDFELHPISNHPELVNKTIRFMHDDIDGNMLIVANNQENTGGLYQLADNKLEKFSFPGLLKGGAYGYFYEDNDGSIWLLSNVKSTLYKWNRKKDNSIEELTADDGLPINGIRRIYHDDEGNIWIGTDGNGIFKYGGSKFTSFLSNEGLEDYFIWSIYEERNGTKWFGTSNNAVLKYSNGVLKTFTPSQNQPLGIVRSINEYNGQLMIGTFNGLYTIRNNQLVQINNEFGLPQFVGINDIEVKNDQLFVSTTGQGLFMHQNGSTRNFTTNNSDLGSNNVNDLQIDREGTIWISSQGGINKFDGDSITYYSCDRHFGPSRIMQLAFDNSNAVWIATYGDGLCRGSIDKNGEMIVDTYDNESGLSSNNVYSVLADNQGNIWAGCQNGVDKISIDQNGNLTSIRNYDNYEGFKGFENNGKANFMDQTGNLWFGTIRGVMVYNPNLDILNLKPPVTQVTKLKLFYKDINWKDNEMVGHYSNLSSWTGLPENLILPYNKNHISFEFEGLSYSVPEKVLFEWMLEGLDENWSPPNSRSDAVYANLPPGYYTFKVKAQNSDGIWTEQPATFSFLIKPPFWGTWWFRGIIILFLFTLVMVVFWLRNKFIQEKREELEQLVAFKTKKLEQQKDEILSKNEELSTQYNNLEMLSKIGRDITANLTIESLLDSVYEKLNTLMDASVLGFGIYNNEKNALEFPFLISKGKKITIAGIDYENNQSLAVQCLKEDREIIINNYDEEMKKSSIAWDPPVKGDDSVSIIFIPLIYNEKQLGVLTVQSTKSNAYNEYQLNILRNLANYAKIALENANAYEKIQEHRNRLSLANQDIIKQKQEIEESNKKLIELNDEKNNIIEIVAHDLKNPLTSALTMADILKSDSRHLEEDQQHCIEIIEKSIKRMNDMINRLLDVRKIENKITELKLEKVNLQEIIKDVNNLLSNEIHRKKIKISVESEELYAQVDPDYAIQVFENLISNAIKFSPPKKNVLVKLIRENGKARAEIIDEGPGLTPEDHLRVFGKFQRLSARPTGGEQSTGLGLSIVKKYVEAMNGKVWCESEPGKGANFIVEFMRID